jgi:putative membrane protein
MSEAQGATKDLRVYFSAERTLLSWIRTGVAMMGFGFVVARVGMYMSESAAAASGAPDGKLSFALWVGTALLVLGVAVTVAGAIGYVRTLRRLNRGDTIAFKPVSLAVMTALSLALIGLVMTAYLVLSVLH